MAKIQVDVKVTNAKLFKRGSVLNSAFTRSFKDSFFVRTLRGLNALNALNDLIDLRLLSENAPDISMIEVFK